MFETKKKAISKEEKKKILLDKKDKKTVTLMGHWNNDSGCRA